MIFHEIPGNNPYFSIKFPGFGIKLIYHEDGRRKLFHKISMKNPYNSMEFPTTWISLISYGVRVSEIIEGFPTKFQT